MKKMLEIIARTLVDNPQSVAVHEVDEGEETVLELEVAQRDLGKVIGKQGRTARALRALAGAVGRKSGRRLTVEILE
jgi:hypothetical protein